LFREFEYKRQRLQLGAADRHAKLLLLASIDGIYKQMHMTSSRQGYGQNTSANMIKQCLS